MGEALSLRFAYPIVRPGNRFFKSCGNSGCNLSICMALFGCRTVLRVESFANLSRLRAGIFVCYGIANFPSRPPQNWLPVHRGRKNENPFCAIMAQSSKTCAACLEVQEKIGRTGCAGRYLGNVFCGIVRYRRASSCRPKVVGFLQTGQVALHAPSAKRFSHIAEKLVNWG